MNNKQFVFNTISHFWEMEEIKVSHDNCCSVVCLVALVIGQSNPILHGVRVAGAAGHRGNVTSDWCLMIWWAAITITLVTQIITSHEWQPAQWLEFMNLFQWCLNRLRRSLYSFSDWSIFKVLFYILRSLLWFLINQNIWVLRAHLF